jgi:hypothetical protein
MKNFLIKLSKNAAKQVGVSFAQSLHEYHVAAQRGVVLDSYSNFLELLHYESRINVQKAYSACLDEIEPLPSSKRVESLFF